MYRGIGCTLLLLTTAIAVTSAKSVNRENLLEEVIEHIVKRWNNEKFPCDNDVCGNNGECFQLGNLKRCRNCRDNKSGQFCELEDACTDGSNLGNRMCGVNEGLGSCSYNPEKLSAKQRFQCKCRGSSAYSEHC